MNYATIEEAWAQPKGILNKFPISAVKHPLLVKHEMAEEAAAAAAASSKESPPVAPKTDSDELDIKTMAGLRKALRRLYDEQGTFGMELVLPKAYLQEHSGTNKTSSEFPSFDTFDIEEIAKWMLMAAVVYIIFDLAR